MAKLYVVATPIGNLSDLTPRMAEAFAAADLIAAEDTRVTLKLLNHLGVSRPLVSYHRHNERARAAELIDRMLRENLTVALASDAGTPGISDPGHVLVDAAWAAGIEVVPVSGPSAVVTALSAAGFDAREFAFYGFLPREKKALDEKLSAIAAGGMPVAVAYESPHRVLKLCEAVARTLPDARLAVCCDLTKRYELTVRGGAEAVCAALSANPNLEKGEYCVVMDLSNVPGAPKRAEAPSAEAEMLTDMLRGLTLDAAAGRAMEKGCARNEVYRARLKIKEFLERGAGGARGE